MPLKTTLRGSGGVLEGRKTSRSTPFGTTSTGAPGATARTIRASRSDVTAHPAARRHQRCSKRRKRACSTRLNARRGPDRSPSCIRAKTSYSRLCSSTTTGTPGGNENVHSRLVSTWTTSTRRAAHRASMRRCIACERTLRHAYGRGDASDAACAARFAARDGAASSTVSTRRSPGHAAAPSSRSDGRA